MDEAGISSHHIVKVKGHGREEIIIDPADDIWYENVPVGKNKLGNFLKYLSECIGVSKVYTNHSIRATSVTLLDEVGISSHHIVKVKGHGREEVIIDPADDIWYENVPVGKNKLENFLKDLSECVGVSKVYTNHSIRATSVTLPGGGGTPIITPTGMCPKFGCLFQGKILLLGMKFE